MNVEKKSAAAYRQSSKIDGPPRLTRQDWINGAIQKLSEDSVAALRVDELAEFLNVTKGSFYWHFENREDLLGEVLDSWRSMMTTETKDLIGQLPNEPWDRLRNLLRIAISSRPDVPGGPFELTLRDWARRDSKVAKVVRLVDDARIAFVAELYEKAGLDSQMAQDYAIAQMAYVIGGKTAFTYETPAELARRRKIAEALFLPKHLGKSRTD
jgi:AcrR family transcriptional regulator